MPKPQLCEKLAVTLHPRPKDEPTNLPATTSSLATSQRGRFSDLDALRGLAALVVVFHHFASAFNLTRLGRAIVLGLLRPLTAGHEAVTLFFVLSGFVLSLPTWRGKALDYGSYLIRRICRIYLPYVFALLVAVAGASVFHGSHAHLSDWFLLTWTQAPTWPLTLQHLFFIGDYNSSEYNTAFWSLVFEMRISLIFPFVCMLLARLSTTAGVALALGCSALTYILSLVLPAGAASPSRLFETPHYLAFFILGALLARHIEQARAPGAESKLTLRSVAAILLFFFAFMVVVHDSNSLLRLQVGEWLCGLGAVELVYLGATHRAIQNVLAGRWAVSLGRISYSLYLLHGTILFVLLNTLYGRVPVWVLFLIFVAISLVVATIAYRLVEQPSIRFGRWLTGRKQPAAAPQTA